MDVRMPVMDGLTATRLIRDELGLTELPIIALTAGVLPDQQEAAHAAGVNAVLPKPLELERLTAALLSWIKPHRTLTHPTPSRWTPDQAVLPTRTATGDNRADAFPAIAGIDQSHAAHTPGHDRALFIRLLERFIAEFADVAGQTGRDLLQGARETAARRMHTLRGNAGILGMMELMALAGQLETAIERGETDLAERLAALGHQIDALVAASATVLAATTVQAAAPESTATLDSGALAALRADLHSHALTAWQRFDDLQAALRGVLGEARTAAVGQAIRSLRYKEALAILSDLP
jgi:CheY-like chemotaxis protein